MYSKGVIKDIVIPFSGFIVIIALLLSAAGLLSGCSYQKEDDNSVYARHDSAYVNVKVDGAYADGPYYTYAYIQLPNGEIIEGTIDDYAIGADDGGVRVKINGNWYYTSNVNCVLTNKNLK